MGLAEIHNCKVRWENILRQAGNVGVNGRDAQRSASTRGFQAVRNNGGKKMVPAAAAAAARGGAPRPYLGSFNPRRRREKRPENDKMKTERLLRMVRCEGHATVGIEAWRE